MSRLTVSVMLAGAVAAVLSGVLVGAAASQAEVQRRSGTIAFLRTVGTGPSTPSGLFVIRAADGSGLRRLASDVTSYEWSPDGSRIAYLDGRGALRLVGPDGTGRELLAASSPLRSLWDLSWSPDGKAIAVLARNPAAPPQPKYSGSGFGIVVIPTDGGKPRRLPSGNANQLSLDWSPRGDEIIYGAPRGTKWIIRTDGSKARSLFRSPPSLSRPLGYPIWSSDGTHVGFVASVPHGHGSQLGPACGCSDRYDAIYVSDADGSNLHLVTSHAYNEYGFAWSPDGRSILYGRANREGIYVIGADGRNNHRLTRDSPTPTEFPALTWAPDGRSIAYETDRTGNGDIYVIDANGHNKIRLTSSTASDGSPSWQPQ